MLETAIKDKGYREELDSIINGIVESLDRGFSKSRIKLDLERKNLRNSNFLAEIAQSRINVRGKFSRSDRLWLDSYSARYSTPEIIGTYRAGRIHGETLYDIGSGGGMQAIFFSKTNAVTGFEVDRTRYLESLLNAIAYESGNVEFINKEWPAEITDRMKDAVFFSDPLRSPDAGERILQDLVPPPESLMKHMAGTTDKFAFDIPPQTRVKRLPESAETEYISVNGVLNRLTLYFGDLKETETRAVMLPQGNVISGERGEISFTAAQNIEEYICTVDPALVYAGLTNKINEIWQCKLLGSDKRRVLLTGMDDPDRSTPGVIYRTIEICDNSKLDSSLRSIGAKRVFPRFEISPDEYYALKNRLEQNTNGDRDIYVFKAFDRFALCEKLY